jgi:hypothetical protein
MMALRDSQKLMSFEKQSKTKTPARKHRSTPRTDQIQYALYPRRRKSSTMSRRLEIQTASTPSTSTR